MRTVLIWTAGPLLIVAILGGVFGRDASIWIILALVALFGMILGAMRERDERETGSQDGGTREALRLALEAVLVTRSPQQEADYSGPRLVTDEASGSEPQPPRQSAG